MLFKAVLEKFDANLWGHHVKVPPKIVKELKQKEIKRFLCSLNGTEPFHTALMPAGDGIYFINVSKKLRGRLIVQEGDTLEVQIAEDESEYGFPLPEELSEIFVQDPIADRHFHRLTPGKQRTLIYIVDKVKSPELKVEKSMIIMEHLKDNQGRLDFRELHEAFKRRI